MKILIVDDEVNARRLLKGMLNDIFECKDESLELFEAQDLVEAVSKINSYNPDIVLLDIEMPEHTGLEILDFFKDKVINFNIIFTTAYSQYAIEAFKLNAIDYLLKPIDYNELELAIDKSKEIIARQSIEQKLDNLRETFLELSNSKILLEVPNGFLFVKPDDIITLEADGMYTNIYLKDKSKILITKPLKYFEIQLSKYSFFYRSHRAHLINLKYLKELTKKEGFKIVLDNGMRIPLSRERKEEFLSLINELF